MGRDLVIRKAEDTWGAGIVEQVSLDLKNEFPETKGFSARNLWSMKKWYSFYSSVSEFGSQIQRLSEQIDLGSIKLHQIGAEMQFPTVFGFVPWRHHVEIVNRCKTVEEALFYVKKTIENGLSYVSLPQGYDENTLEDALEKNITRFLLELGTGFAFVGRQQLPTVEQIQRRIAQAEEEYRLSMQV